ncbi:MAG: AlpA family phage regulatory protein [Gammaproteobacteria bacterium]
MIHLDPENPLHESGFIRLSEVLQLIPIGKSSWWNGIKTGRYPKGVKLGARTTAWRVSDINQLLKKLGEQGGQS